jgi:rod shape determining protein RodA
MSKANPPQQNVLANRGIDWVMMSLFISLVVIGWLMVYSSNYDGSNAFSFLDISSEMGRQTLWLIISVVIFISVLAIDWSFWNSFAMILYSISIVLLILVLFFGTEVKGNKSWFNFGFIGFQPSEIAKFATSLALASYMSFNKNSIKNPKVLLTTLGIFLLPMFLILLQPDAGSALVFTSFFLLLFRKGLDAIYYILAFILLIIFIVSLKFGPIVVTGVSTAIGFGLMLFNYEFKGRTLGVFAASIIASVVLAYYNFTWPAIMVNVVGLLISFYLLFKERKMRELILISGGVVSIVLLSFTTNYLFEDVIKPHQQERINIWLRPERCDPKGPLYNLIQSKLAIGSGGFIGKGYLNGEMTKLNYVPEQDTDFIFSIVGEEHGFLGTTSVIVLFVLLIMRMIVIAERARLEFIKNYAYCLAGIFFIHFFINIGMTMGLMPIIGIPLPLVSRGGTSLLFFSIMVAVLVKFDASRFRT